jgi:hypothetical protein
MTTPMWRVGFPLDGGQEASCTQGEYRYLRMGYPMVAEVMT